MEKLTQQQIKDGWRFFNKYISYPKYAVEVAENAGEKELSINCTQLDGFDIIITWQHFGKKSVSRNNLNHKLNLPRRIIS